MLATTLKKLFFRSAENSGRIQSGRTVPHRRLALESLEARLNPAPLVPLSQMLDAPSSLVVLSPDVADRVPTGELSGSRVLVLDSGRDAVGQITEALAARPSTDVVRLISHGQAGALELAGRSFDLAGLAAQSDEVAEWSRFLSPDADILLYGCSVASTAEGRAFVDRLARLTGADVAASVDPTGAGGNLDLEYAVGEVESQASASFATWEASGLQLPTVGDFSYAVNPDGITVSVTGYSGVGGAVSIPGTLGGLPVTAIGPEAFYNKTNLTSATIPTSVTSIGANAFSFCN